MSAAYFQIPYGCSKKVLRVDLLARSIGELLRDLEWMSTKPKNCYP